MEDDSSLLGRIKRTFSGKSEDSEQAEEEILSLMKEGHDQGLFDKDEVELIRNVFTYKEKNARDIMTHRKHIVGLDGTLTMAELMPFILEQSNSRFPVYQENIDNIVGVFHLRDAMKCFFDEALKNQPIGELKSCLRPVSFVPETKDLEKLFNQMKEEQNHLVIVLDEYGQTTGLVAMEDILEVIVGDILDEYDEDEINIIKQTDSTYFVKGMTPLEELEECLEISFEDEDNDTLNGFLIMLLEHIPTTEEHCSLEYGGYHFRVLAVAENVIQSVKIEKVDVL